MVDKGEWMVYIKIRKGPVVAHGDVSVSSWIKRNRKRSLAMEKKEKSVRLYNVMFPIWLLMLIPVLWIWLLPINFFVDSLVVLGTMAYFHYEGKKQVWKKSILRVWGIGFLSDMIGALLIFGIYSLVVSTVNWEVHMPPLEQIITLPGIALAGVMIYYLNRKFAFRKTDLDPSQIHKICLALAVFTAPYTMLIPMSWIYY